MKNIDSVDQQLSASYNNFQIQIKKKVEDNSR